MPLYGVLQKLSSATRRGLPKSRRPSQFNHQLCRLHLPTQGQVIQSSSFSTWYCSLRTSQVTSSSWFNMAVNHDLLDSSSSSWFNMAVNHDLLDSWPSCVPESLTPRGGMLYHAFHHHNLHLSITLTTCTCLSHSPPAPVYLHTQSLYKTSLHWCVLRVLKCSL